VRVGGGGWRVRSEKRVKSEELRVGGEGWRVRGEE
jgi:hypothetical protein